MHLPAVKMVFLEIKIPVQKSSCPSYKAATYGSGLKVGCPPPNFPSRDNGLLKSVMKILYLQC